MMFLLSNFVIYYVVIEYTAVGYAEQLCSTIVAGHYTPDYDPRGTKQYSSATDFVLSSARGQSASHCECS